ncbi:MAG: zinc-dependent metalloprotease [Bacteroidota bacterium]
MVRTLLLLLFSFTVGICVAQNWWEASTNDHDRTSSLLERPKTQITIPVVVHVVWRTEEERLAVDRVASQIEVLNEDYRRLNLDIEDVHFAFQGVTADMEINFVLATEDPEGQPHSGIVERQTSETNLAGFTGGRRRLCYNDLGGSTAWCTSCYLNIWVADLNLDGVAGIGIFPTQIADGEVPADEDGVYIQPDRFGRSTNPEGPFDLGRTCTHEIGHYLNLLHLWGVETPPADCNDCCGNPAYDDFVDDTPFQVETHAGECPGPFTNTCVTVPNDRPDNVQNFMGFGTDECALMFTEGQKVRVWDALQTYRPGFLLEDCRKACMVSTTDFAAEQTNLVLIRHNGGREPALETLVPGVDWELYRVDGQLVKSGQQELMGTVPWNLLNIEQGLYLLRATHQGSWQTTKLFIARN